MDGLNIFPTLFIVQTVQVVMKGNVVYWLNDPFITRSLRFLLEGANSSTCLENVKIYGCEEGRQRVTILTYLITKHLLTHLPIYLLTNLPTYLLTYPPTYKQVPTYLPTYLPTNLPTYLPTNQPTYQPTYLPTNQPTYLPTHLPTYLPTNLPINLPTYLLTQQPISRYLPTYCN